MPPTLQVRPPAAFPVAWTYPVLKEPLGITGARPACACRCRRRARIILLLVDGYSYSTIYERVDCTPPTIATWKRRFQASGVAGLRGRHRGSKARVLTPRVEARGLSWTSPAGFDIFGPHRPASRHEARRREHDGVPSDVRRRWPSMGSWSTTGHHIDPAPRQSHSQCYCLIPSPLFTLSASGSPSGLLFRMK